MEDERERVRVQRGRPLPRRRETGIHTKNPLGAGDGLAVQRCNLSENREGATVGCVAVSATRTSALFAEAAAHPPHLRQRCNDIVAVAVVGAAGVAVEVQLAQLAVGAEALDGGQVGDKVDGQVELLEVLAGWRGVGGTVSVLLAWRPLAITDPSGGRSDAPSHPGGSQ